MSEVIELCIFSFKLTGFGPFGLEAYMECWTASWAAFEGKKSFTATSLFSFFLSELFVKERKKKSLLFVPIVHKSSLWNPKILLKKKKKHTVFKEAPDLSQPMRWKLSNVSVVSIFRIVSAYCNDLIILLSLVYKQRTECHMPHNPLKN